MLTRDALEQEPDSGKCCILARYAGFDGRFRHVFVGSKSALVHPFNVIYYIQLIFS